MTNFKARRAELDNRFKKSVKYDTSLFVDNADRKRRIRVLKETVGRFFAELALKAALDKEARLDLRDTLMQDSRFSQIGDNDETLFDELLEEVVGFGIMERISRNTNVTDVTFNGSELVIESNGEKCVNDTNGLVDTVYIEELVKKFATASGSGSGEVATKDFNSSKPILDIVVGNQRLNAVHGSSAQNGITLAIRISQTRVVVTSETILKMAPKSIGSLLKSFVKAQFNITLAGRTGTGKAQPESTLIPTPQGFRRLGDIQVGDQVFTQDGLVTEVIGVYPQGKKPVTKLTFADNRVSYSNAEHLWSVITGNEFEDSDTDTDVDVITTKVIQDRLAGGEFVAIPLNHAVNFDTDLVDDYSTMYAHSIGKSINQSLDVLAVEHIIYMSADTREAFIQGVCDSYGKLVNTPDRHVLIKLKTEDLAYLIATILRSLGIVVSVSGKDLMILDDSVSEATLFSTSKAYLSENHRHTAKAEMGCLEIVSAETLDESVEMVCIEVYDYKHTYLTEDFIVTHNTEVTKYLVSEIPFREKIVLIEDVSEMHAKQLFPHLDVHSWVTTPTAPATALLKASLRNNPEWVIVTELRSGEEAVEWLEAIKSDHRSITSLHAKTAYDIPSRIHGMYSEVRDTGEELFIQNVMRLLDIGIQIEAKIINGEKVRYISEVMEYRPEVDGGPILLFKQKMDMHGNSRYEFKQMSPELREKLDDAGADYTLFTNDVLDYNNKLASKS